MYILYRLGIRPSPPNPNPRPTINLIDTNYLLITTNYLLITTNYLLIILNFCVKSLWDKHVQDEKANRFNKNMEEDVDWLDNGKRGSSHDACFHLGIMNFSKLGLHRRCCKCI